MTSIKTFIKSLILSCLFFVASAFVAVNAQAAPRLYFDPASTNTNGIQDFDAFIKIDAEDKSVFGADVSLTFSSGDLSVKSVENGGYFTDFTSAQSDGRIEIHGFMSAQFASKTGSGTFAKIVFTTKRTSGSGAVGFVCSDNGETQILNTSGDNILVCANINQLNLTFSGDNGLPPGYSEPNACGGTCGSNYNCAAPLYCYQGFCRNPDCRTDLTCGCKATPKPAATKKPTPKPIGKAGATPEVIILAEFTPFPLSSPPQESPVGWPVEERGGISARTLGILTGIGIIIAAIVLMLIARAKRNKPPKFTPPTTSGPENPVVGYPPPPPPPSSTPPTI